MAEKKPLRWNFKMFTYFSTNNTKITGIVEHPTLSLRSYFIE